MSSRSIFPTSLCLVCLFMSHFSREYTGISGSLKTEDINFSEDREAFRQFVSEDINCCPMDEEFIPLSFTFEIMKGRDVSLLRLKQK